MPKDRRAANGPSYSLRLAGGLAWEITGSDPQAEETVARLARAMRLHRGAEHTTRRLIVSVREGVPPFSFSPLDAAVVECTLQSVEGEEAFVVLLLRLSQLLALASQSSGCLLLHGGLIEKDGAGAVLAGPGDRGKSTACGRVPLPWKALSDDASLAVRDLRGSWWVHPWPSWSTFMFGGKGGTWETERAVRLRGIYFLEQGSTESTVPAGSARAACLLVESTEQILFPVFHAIPPAESRALRRERFDLICSLSSQVPCHFLRLGLEGPFWNKIEETIGTGTFFCAHRGSSMNPTLSAEDALEVEPHSDALREGDVILCRPRDQEDAVVHRVTRITSDGIRTRGDNSSGDDPWLLRREDVSGRVVAAWRGEKRRSVPGGTRGRLAAGIARGRKALDRGLRPALRPLYLSASRGAPAGRLLPERYRPRVVRFNAGGESRRRVLIGQRVVGSYSEERREWMIRRPWRLFVDVTRLPPE